MAEDTVRRYIMDTAQQTFIEKIEGERRAARVVLKDSLAEGIAGGCAIILALLGLMNIMPELTLSISVIVMGVGFLLEGETISARVLRLFGKSGRNPLQEEQPGVGVTAEFVAGITGAALGIIALLGLYPLIAIAISVIAYGSALIFGSGLNARLNDLEIESSGEPVCFTRIVCEALSSSSGVEFLFGLSAGILGMIALTGMEAVMTNSIALLIVGASGFLNGAAITARMSRARKE